MASALNVFKTVTAQITTTPTNIYTSPTGKTTIILMAQVSNVGMATANVTASHYKGNNATELVKNFDIPVSDSSGLLTGKLVLETGDSFRISASDSSSLKIVLSLLETLNA
jgi:hypothetical protein